MRGGSEKFQDFLGWRVWKFLLQFSVRGSIFLKVPPDILHSTLVDTFWPLPNITENKPLL